METERLVASPGTVYLAQGHILDVLKRFDSETFQMVMTSPPYWGLRKYACQPIVWGGSEGCAHSWGEAIVSRKRGSVHGPGAQAGNTRSGISGVGLEQGTVCSLCGAWKGELGLEPSPQLYVEHIVEIFREIRRCLRDDGVVWLNLGDSYAGSGGPGSQYSKAFTKYDNPNRRVDGIKPKDLIGIPWMVAFALREDGWWLRSEVTWCKTAPMPESVKDRPTSATEKVFLLTKSATYFYDSEAVRVPAVYGGYKDPETFNGKNGNGNEGDKWRGKGAPSRNLWNYWILGPKPYRGAHFAVFPEALVEPCIKSGSRVEDMVLDPFIGSGTVGLVAARLGRDCMGIDLSQDYIALAEDRLGKSGVDVCRI